MICRLTHGQGDLAKHAFYEFRCAIPGCRRTWCAWIPLAKITQIRQAADKRLASYMADLEAVKKQ
jgi:hypothetical protein